MMSDGILQTRQSEQRLGDEQPDGDAEASQNSLGFSWPLPHEEGIAECPPVALGFPNALTSKLDIFEKNPPAFSFGAGCAKAIEPVIMSNATTSAPTPTTLSLFTIIPLFDNVHYEHSLIPK